MLQLALTLEIGFGLGLFLKVNRIRFGLLRLGLEAFPNESDLEASRGSVRWSALCTREMVEGVATVTVLIFGGSLVLLVVAILVLSKPRKFDLDFQ